MNAQRIRSIELSAAEETTKRNFEKLTARIGRVPNMPRAMAQSPAALEAWMSLLEALAKGLLTKKLGLPAGGPSTSTESTLRDRSHNVFVARRLVVG
jgi:hypothetical protein